MSIDYDGDGVYDQSSSDLTTPLQHDYTAAGINNVTLRITMADGSYHSAETMVVTQGSDHYKEYLLRMDKYYQINARYLPEIYQSHYSKCLPQGK